MAFEYNPETFVPDTSRSLLPPSNCWMEVESIAYKPTKADNGHYVACVFDILAPEELKGRKWFYNMNVDNPNATAQNMGREAFDGLTKAIGNKTRFTGTETTEEIDEKLQDYRLIGFMAQVEIKKNSKSGDDENGVKKWYHSDAANIPEPGLLAATGRPAAANTNTPAAAAPKSDKPWAKKAA